MREVELKSVVPDLEECEARARAAGARLVFSGWQTDIRYDTPERALAARDEVIRVRIAEGAWGRAGTLDWKGPTSFEGGYKVRTELSTEISDTDACEHVLRQLGCVVTRQIDRDITVYQLGDATVRFERYPLMDTLVEVEGAEDAIEQAIKALELPRSGFTAERLPDFVRRFEKRTGTRAALCARELEGDFRYELDDA